MRVKLDQTICDGHLYKWFVMAGLAWLEHNQARVNQMNVFPVPDGDTGTNMRLTMMRAYQEISHLDERNVGIVSEKVAYGALNGARGNSGVILSQLFRGFADAIKDQDVFDAQDFLRACRSAVDKGYKAVIEPVEGTILTVAREATETLSTHIDETENLKILLDMLLDGARASLANTPNLLPVLKEAGVLDSGGQGLVFILEGMSRLMHGEPIDVNGSSISDSGADDWQSALVPEDEEGYGYDVQFLMRGNGNTLDVAQVRASIDAMGWSTLVVGDENLIKVHVHVHNPGEPLSYAINAGASIDDVVVENMQEQYQHYVEERVHRETDAPVAADDVAVITVAAGDGLKHLFEQDLRASHVISGGQTMNPSTEDFLKVIDHIPNQRIILLPNNKNILMAAQQAASLVRDRDIRVIPTRTIPQGISAMLGYLSVVDGGELDSIEETMLEFKGFVTTLEVTIATRDATIDDVMVKEGQYIGLQDTRLIVSSNTLESVVHALLKKAGADEHEVITLYYGSEVDQMETDALVSTLSDSYPDCEIVVVHGGQPLYPYIISVE